MARTANICNSKQCLSPLQQIWFKCHSSFNEIYTVQTVSRSALKSSINENICELWSITSTNRNIQYDIYSNTKDVLKAFRQKNEQRLQNNLMSQDFFFLKHFEKLHVGIQFPMVIGSFKTS